MSLRALGSLLSRRLSPCGIANARRDLDVVGGSMGALAAAGGVTALIGVLYSNGDESSLVVTGKEIKNVMTEELEGMSADELGMNAMIEEWMKQSRRTYQNAIWCDKANAQSKSKVSIPWELNDLAEWTFEEKYGSGGRVVDNSLWEEYFNEGYPTVDAWQWYQEKKKSKAKKAELDAATKAEQVGATRKKEEGC